MKNSAKSKRFSDTSHVDKYLSDGIIPNIYQPLVHLACSEHVQGNILDVGSCYGVLGDVLANLLNCKCYHIEPNKNYTSKHVAPSTLIGIAIEQKTLPKIAELLDNEDIHTVILRRVLPEIYSHDREVLPKFLRLLYERNCTLLVEGRVKSNRSVHPLQSIEEEIDYIKHSGYVRIKMSGNLAIATI